MSSTHNPTRPGFRAIDGAIDPVEGLIWPNVHASGCQNAVPVTRRVLLGCLAALAIVPAGCGQSPDAGPAASLRAVDGLEQDGFTLGQTTAPVTLTLYAPPTDPRFLELILDELPALAPLLKRGELRLQARTLSTGADASQNTAEVARYLQAAGTRGRLWQTLVLLSDRYVGTVSPGFWDALLSRAGLPAAEVGRLANSSRIRAAVERGDAAGFSAGTGGSEPRYVLAGASSSADITREITSNGLAAAVRSALTNVR